MTTQTQCSPTLKHSIHFIGIGGIGMSGLAFLLAKGGHKVSGSDIQRNAQTEKLRAHGVSIHIGHSPEVIEGVEQVVYSTAIADNDPELKRAHELGIEVLHRSQVLAALSLSKKLIGISGTHGKTTTTSMMGSLLCDADFDPMVVIGAQVDSLGGNAKPGSGEYLVAEVDESDRSLLHFHPEIAVVTNVEADHLDHYEGIDDIVETFQQFIAQSQHWIACLDDANITERLIPASTIPWTGYSLDNHPLAQFRADEVHYGAECTKARIWEKTGEGKGEREEILGILELGVLGRHNLSNALAVVAVARKLGLPFSIIAQSLKHFQGAQRRFQERGQRDGVVFIDDYAHHPSEIRATLATAKLHPGRRVVAIFQPHRYTRTKALFAEFSTAFQDADVVVLTDIYSAGETYAGLDGSHVADAVRQHHTQVHYCPSLGDVSQWLQRNLHPGDMAVFLGAGNINTVIPELLQLESASTKEQPKIKEEHSERAPETMRM
jgi:UDP-N-acetylmuramate--alanine ligase